MQFTQPQHRRKGSRHPYGRRRRHADGGEWLGWQRRGPDRVGGVLADSGEEISLATIKSSLIFGSESDENDQIIGSDAADTLRGGKGADLLVGGLGADTYVYSAGDGDDRIADGGMPRATRSYQTMSPGRVPRRARARAASISSSGSIPAATGSRCRQPWR